MLLNKKKVKFLHFGKKKNTSHGSVSHLKKKSKEKKVNVVNVTVQFPGFLGKRD